jgi:hypothetical protein
MKICSPKKTTDFNPHCSHVQCELVSTVFSDLFWLFKKRRETNNSYHPQEQLHIPPGVTNKKHC